MGKSYVLQCTNKKEDDSRTYIISIDEEVINFLDNVADVEIQGEEKFYLINNFRYKLTIQRKSGRSTRLLDKYVQELFTKGKVLVRDHYNNFESHRILAGKLLERLSNEKLIDENDIFVCNGGTQIEIRSEALMKYISYYE